MNLLIVGNGLDLALGYPTRSIDCGKWLKKEANNFPKINKNLNYMSKYYSHKFFINEFWSNIESNITKVKKSLRGKSVTENDWNNNNPWNALYSSFEFWVGHICKYVDTHRPIPINLKEYSIIKKLVKQADWIITFNYTKTLENFFHCKDYNIIHIHTNPDNTPVLGHEPINISNENQSFKDFAENSLKSTDGCYSTHLNKLEQIHNVSNISFIGLSYGKTDWPYYSYFKNLFLQNNNDHSTKFFNPNCIGNFFFHNTSKELTNCKNLHQAKALFKHLNKLGIINNNNYNFIQDSTGKRFSYSD